MRYTFDLQKFPTLYFYLLNIFIVPILALGAYIMLYLGTLYGYFFITKYHSHNIKRPSTLYFPSESTQHCFTLYLSLLGQSLPVDKGALHSCSTGLKSPT